MDNLPHVTITDAPISTWGNRVNQHVRQNQVGSSSDFVVGKSGAGTALKLKKKFKASFDFMRYKGEYDPDAAYSVNDVVTVMPGTDYTDGDGANAESPAGTWICVAPVPSLTFTRGFHGDSVKYSRYLRQDDIDYSPQWPLKPNKATQTEPDGRYWVLLSLLPKEMVTCDNGTEKTTYVDSFDKPTGGE